MSHLKNLQASMKREGAEAIVVSSSVNLRYLSGLHYEDGFALILPDAAFLLAPFAFFRLFDIWKPWPVHASESWLPGGWGIMIDDVFAGLWALLCTSLTLMAAHRFLPGLITL